MSVTTAIMRPSTEVNSMFDDGATSIACSLESLDAERLIQDQATLSMFQTEESEAESDHSSTPWSPPAWRKGASGWQQRHNLPPPSESVSRSRSPSQRYEDDTLLPSKIPLPASPEKDTPRHSREPTFGMDRSTHHTRSPSAIQERSRSTTQATPVPPTDQPDNYLRLAFRADIQQRTEPIEAAVTWARHQIDRFTKSPLYTLGVFLSILLAFIMTKSLLLRPPDQLPTPDILQATEVARRFEPLIYYSEGGRRQVGQLQDTGAAVWDLGESIRHANMPSGTQIVEQLDDLGTSLETLVIELTRFFVNVDGDIDSILHAMQWAKRRLQTIEPMDTPSIGNAIDNIQSSLKSVGLMQAATGRPTIIGRVVQSVLGQTTMERNLATVQTAFNEFLNVLEESINNQLQHSVNIFALFETIDRGFQNLHRIVVRENSSQDREEAEMLSSLWTRVLGARASDIQKFEKNKQLLASLRNQTIQNKHLLKEHNNKLLQMKSTLDMMRRKIASQLVRGNSSSTPPVDEQIQGLHDTWEQLKHIRDQQKQKTLNLLQSSGSGGIPRREIGMGIR